MAQTDDVLIIGGIAIGALALAYLGWQAGKGAQALGHAIDDLNPIGHVKTGIRETKEGVVKVAQTAGVTRPISENPLNPLRSTVRVAKVATSASKEFKKASTDFEYYDTGNPVTTGLNIFAIGPDVNPITGAKKWAGWWKDAVGIGDSTPDATKIALGANVPITQAKAVK